MSGQVWLLATGSLSKLPTGAERLKARGSCFTATAITRRFSRAAQRDRTLRKAGDGRAHPGGLLRHGGPFGFEADKFEVSKAIANDGCFPRSSPPIP